MTKTRRCCRIPGCTKIIKSQGLCQRHGAKTRLCKVDGCSKQAQGNFDGMCKAHFKKTRVDLKETLVIPSTRPPPPSGQSVYDSIIPASIAFRPSQDNNDLMPLVAHLKQGFDENRPRGWHRNEERRARGLWPVSKATVQLQAWERELVWMEICILSGNPQASFRHLARAWGRDKGFHMVLSQFICERRGNVEVMRKKRPKSGAGSLKTENGDGSGPPAGFLDDILSYEEIEMLDVLRNSDAGSAVSHEGLEYDAESVPSHEGMQHHVPLSQAAAAMPHNVVPSNIAATLDANLNYHHHPAGGYVHSHAEMLHGVTQSQVAAAAAHPLVMNAPVAHHPGAAFVDPLDEHLLMTQHAHALDHTHAIDHTHVAAAGTEEAISKEQSTLLTTPML